MIDTSDPSDLVERKKVILKSLLTVMSGTMSPASSGTSWTEPKSLRKLMSRDKDLARDVALIGLKIKDIDYLDCLVKNGQSAFAQEQLMKMCKHINLHTSRAQSAKR